LTIVKQVRDWLMAGAGRMPVVDAQVAAQTRVAALKFVPIL